MSYFRIACIALALCTCATNSLVAQRDPDARGKWSGNIDVPGTPLAVTVAINTTDGGYSGTIDIPAQRSFGLALANVTVDGSKVSFAIRGVPGDPTFSGAVEGDRMSGQFTQGGASMPFTLLRITADTARQAEQGLADKLDSIRAFMRGALSRWNVPGASIAVLFDGRVVLTEGFGYRDLEEHTPVSANTLMPIGSTTKAFTAFLLGTLVEEGKIAWDSPVVDYLPDFKLADEVSTRSLRVRDLLTHVSGLPRHDFSWYGSNLSRGELYDRLKYLETSAPVRTRWQYQNMMFMTAGILAERVTGKSWETLVDERIFTPLAMTSTNTSIAKLRGFMDHATGYAERGGKLTPVPFRNLDAIGPAGAINSSAAQLEHWLEVQIGSGEFEGRRLIDAGVLAEIHSPQVVMPRTPSPAGDRMLFNLYAMGWMEHAYLGRRLLHHDGAIDGFSTTIGFLPDERIGVAVLSNRGGTGLSSAAFMTIVDILLDEHDFDWEGDALKSIATMDSTIAASRRLADDAIRIPNTRPSHRFTDYGGEYEHPAYGVIAVRAKGDRLNAVLHGIDVELEHYHYDIFRIADATSEANGLLVEFRGDRSGDISSVAIAFESAVAPIEFTRRVADEMRDPKTLDRYVGQYTMGAQIVTVKRRDITLTLVVTGQPEFELVATGNGAFGLKGLDGYTIQFTPRGERADRAIFIQPNGTFAAVRK